MAHFVTPSKADAAVSHPAVDQREIKIEGELDVYSQEYLSSIMAERFERGLDFYVVVCQSGKRDFFFEAGRFVEHFVKESEKHKPLPHPMTREEITSFKVYKATPEAPQLVHVFDESQARCHVNCLPILLSDHTRSEKERGIYYFMLGECYDKGKDCDPDPERAVFYLTKGAELGNEDARHNLVIKLSYQGKTHEALFWAIKPWEGRAIENVLVQGINEIANCFERLGDSTRAFQFFKEAACRGNPYGIAKVIRYYDEGIGVNKSAEKAESWKEFIPSEWRGKSSLEYLKHVVERPRLIKLTCRRDIPNELKSTERPKTLPNPNDFSSWTDRLMKFIMRA